MLLLTEFYIPSHGTDSTRLCAGTRQNSAQGRRADPTAPQRLNQLIRPEVEQVEELYIYWPSTAQPADPAGVGTGRRAILMTLNQMIRPQVEEVEELILLLLKVQKVEEIGQLPPLIAAVWSWYAWSKEPIDRGASFWWDCPRMAPVVEPLLSIEVPLPHYHCSYIDGALKGWKLIT